MIANREEAREAEAWVRENLVDPRSTPVVEALRKFWLGVLLDPDLDFVSPERNEARQALAAVDKMARSVLIRELTAGRENR